jgi:TonB family protein
MFELSPKTSTSQQEGSAPTQEQRRLLVALVLLLVALSIVLVKNRDFWFGSEQEVESASADSERPSIAPSPSATSKPTHEPISNTASLKAHPATAPAEPMAVPEKIAAPDSPVVATKRTILPPLEVEVVAGDSHSTVRPGSNVSKVEITELGNGPAINAAERARVSPAHEPEIRQSLDATYPLLGQRARVQGSVVLRAVVGADGAIENLRVLSGPAILSTAAQQAVRQWRFKPVLQNGQAVETEATITVNFSIRVSDNTASAI